MSRKHRGYLMVFILNLSSALFNAIYGHDNWAHVALFIGVIFGFAFWMSD